MRDEDVSRTRAVAVSVVDHLRESQWSRASGMNEEGNSLDDWLDFVKELLRGTGINFERTTIGDFPSMSEEREPRAS